MKIAQIAPPWISVPPQNYGGTENVIYNLVEEQVRLGHDVTLFAPDDAKTSAKQVSFFPKSLINDKTPWSAYLKAYYHLYKSLESAKDFDIIHTHLSSSTDMFLFPLCTSLITPYMMTLHSTFPFDHLPNGWVGDSDHYYLEWASSMPVVAISKSSLKNAPSGLNFVGVVHHGLPMKIFQPSRRKEEDYFVWLGRFIPEKGAHLAIRAAKKARVPIVLAGIVDGFVQEALDYFHSMIDREVDNELVKYIGPVNIEQKIELLSNARGFLNPIQLEESFGMVMIEAMSLGCPVISFARGAAPELIVHGETGFLVQNIDEMAHYISRITEIDRNVTRMHIANNFSADVMVKKYMNIYRDVITMFKRREASCNHARVFPKKIHHLQ